MHDIFIQQCSLCQSAQCNYAMQYYYCVFLIVTITLGFQPADWVEFSPYEIGMAKYGTFMTPDLFGSKFFMGTVVKKYEENPLHFLMGEKHVFICSHTKKTGFPQDLQASLIASRGNKRVNECEHIYKSRHFRGFLIWSVQEQQVQVDTIDTRFKPDMFFMFFLGVWGSAFSILFNRVLGVKDRAGGSTMEEELGNIFHSVCLDWTIQVLKNPESDPIILPQGRFICRSEGIK